MVNRIVKLPINHSFFLFGARGTGKSTLLKGQFGAIKHHWIDLLDDMVLDKYLMNPQLLQQEIQALDRPKRPEWIIIDEVQKAPRLLNVVHQMIEGENKQKFALTGSSARKLKQKGVNLLAGRAFVENLFPLTALELGKGFNLSDTLQWGTLPHATNLTDPEDKKKYLLAFLLTH